MPALVAGIVVFPVEETVRLQATFQELVVW
jgi:hypothetical protein